MLPPLLLIVLILLTHHLLNNICKQNLPPTIYQQLERAYQNNLIEKSEVEDFYNDMLNAGELEKGRDKINALNEELDFAISGLDGQLDSKLKK